MTKKELFAVLDGTLKFGVRKEKNFAPSATVPGMEFNISAYMGLTDIERAQIAANLPKSAYNNVKVDDLSIIDRPGTDKFDVAMQLKREEKNVGAKLSDLAKKEKITQKQKEDEKQKGS